MAASAALPMSFERLRGAVGPGDELAWLEEVIRLERARHVWWILEDSKEMNK